MDFRAQDVRFQGVKAVCILVITAIELTVND